MKILIIGSLYWPFTYHKVIKRWIAKVPSNALVITDGTQSASRVAKTFAQLRNLKLKSYNRKKFSSVVNSCMFTRLIIDVEKPDLVLYFWYHHQTYLYDSYLIDYLIKQKYRFYIINCFGKCYNLK